MDKLKIIYNNVLKYLKDKIQLLKSNEINNKIVILTSNSHFETNELVDIVLSPSFYWSRVFEIPAQNKKDIKNITKHLYEDFLDMENFKFFTQHIEGTKYIAIAYNEQDILKSIENANLNIKNVLNIYFSQFEFLGQVEPIQVDDELYFYQDNILVKIPNNISLGMSATQIDENSIKLSNHKITINQTLQYIDAKYLKILTVVFAILFVVNVVKIISINSSINELDTVNAAISKNLNMPKTNIQRKSIIAYRANTRDDFTKLSSTLEYMLRFRNNFSAKVRSVKYEKKKLTVEYISADMNKIKQYIKNKYEINSISQTNDIVRVSVKL